MLAVTRRNLATATAEVAPAADAELSALLNKAKGPWGELTVDNKVSRECGAGFASLSCVGWPPTRQIGLLAGVWVVGGGGLAETPPGSAGPRPRSLSCVFFCRQLPQSSGACLPSPTTPLRGGSRAWGRLCCPDRLLLRVG